MWKANSWGSVMINYKLIHPDAKFNESNRATEGSAGLDLYTTEDVLFKSGPKNWGYQKVRTGVCLDMSNNYSNTSNPTMLRNTTFAILVARSSLFDKFSVTMPALGIIDRDYQGELLIPLLAHFNEDINRTVIPKGTAIAQLVFMSYEYPHLQSVTEFKNTTSRGAGGFGSTDTTEETKECFC